MNDARRRNEKPWQPSEIISQIHLTREQKADAGSIHWSMACLMEDRGGIATALQREVYSARALIPASPWLDDQSPLKPKVKLESGGKLKFEPGGVGKVANWVVQTQVGQHWRTSILPGETKSQHLEGTPDAVAVTAVDRCGVASAPAVLQRSSAPGK